MEYFVDSKEKKKKIKLWCKSNPEYRFRKMILNIMYVVFVMAIIWFIVGMVVWYNPFVGFIPLVITFWIAAIYEILLFMAIKEKFNLPYSTQERENGILYPDYFEFRFFDAQRKMEEGMCVYRIAYKDIQTLDFQDRLGIVTITGRSEYLVYDNYFANIINGQLSQPQSAPNAQFTFMLTGEQKYDFLAQLRSRIQLSQNVVA